MFFRGRIGMEKGKKKRVRSPPDPPAGDRCSGGPTPRKPRAPPTESNGKNRYRTGDPPLPSGLIYCLWIWLKKDVGLKLFCVFDGRVRFFCAFIKAMVWGWFRPWENKQMGGWIECVLNNETWTLL